MEWDGRRKAAVISTWSRLIFLRFSFFRFFLSLSPRVSLLVSLLSFLTLSRFLCLVFSLAFYFLVLFWLSPQQHCTDHLFLSLFLSLSLQGAVRAELTTREAAQYILEIIRLLGSCAFTLIHLLVVCLVTASLYTGTTAGLFAASCFGIIAIE